MAKNIGVAFPKIAKTELSELIPAASKQAIDLLEKMMSFNPASRPKANECLSHQYFDGFKPASTP
jgi:serine/threonine protein kinase